MTDANAHAIDMDKSKKQNPLDVQFVPSKVDDAKNDQQNEESKPDATPSVPPVPFHKLYKYASKKDLICIYVGIAAGLLVGVLPVFSTWIFGTLVDTMVQLAMTLNTPEADVAGFWHEVEMFALYSSLLGIVTLIGTYISVMLFNYSAHNQIFRIRCEYLKAVLSKDVEWFDVNQCGEFASRMNEDLTKLGEGLGEKVVMFVQFFATFLGSLIFALVAGWQLALVTMASHPITLLVILVVTIITSRLAKREMEAYAKAGVVAEEAFGAIRTVVSFGGENRESQRYSENLIEARELNVRKAAWSGCFFAVLWFCIYGTYALSFWYGVGLIVEQMSLPMEDRTYTAGTMLMVLMAAMQAGMSMAQTGALVEVFGMAMGAAAKVFDVIEQKSKINTMVEEDAGDRPTSFDGSLQFSNVHFNYPSRADVSVLQGISLTIRKGETVALVGSSGCGKSTCVQLIQRFYDPDMGSVLLDNRDIRELNVNWLRSHIGVVGQEPVLFGTTIAENIRYGFETATREQIEAAAKAANAHNFIVRLPQGYDTLVGERGAQMSGGQKQRIAIARALVRDPEILLLDEATSALDAASEAKVQEALESAQKGRTTVIVAHRLSTIRNASRIVVLNAGKIVEQGDHRALIAKRGHYYDLVMAQTGSVEQDGDLGQPLVNRSMSYTDSDAVPIDFIPEETVDEDAEPKMSFWNVLKWNRPESMFLIIGTVTSVIMGIGMPIFSVVSGEIIQVLSNPDPEAVRRESNTFVYVYIGAGVLVGAASFFQMWTFGVAGERLTERLRAAAFNAMLRMEIAWFDDKRNGTGTLCSRLSTDAASVQGATGQRIGSVVSALSTAVISIAIGMFYSWRLGLVSLAFMPLIIVAHYYEFKMTNQTNLGAAKALERSTKIAVEVVSNIRTVVALGRERMFNGQYVDLLAPSLVDAKRLTHVRGFVFGLARSMMNFANAACMAYGAHLVVTNEMGIAAVFVVTSALIGGSASIAGSLAFAPNFTKGLQAAAKIDDLVKRAPLIQSPTTPVKPDAAAVGSARFVDTEFAYASRPNSRVLQQLNLDIKPGQTVALVGQSGCGKSTCLQLLVRYYDALGGVVELDGANVRSLELAALRSSIGIVSQEPSLFDRTIAENIAYGDNSRDVPRADIIEAAKLANIHTFVASLPLGYDTRLGSKGTQLSGGQKQRVAIARALLRRPKVLLLDEATSALDMESEKVVQAALDAASVGRTCVTIAHRLSTIVNSDVIFVVHQGQVVERGTHKELLELQGRYHRMYTLQTGGGQ